MTPTLERITELRATGRRAAVATLVATTGGAIRRLGETMWVDDHGAIVGSVTIGGCIDARVVELAEDALRTGASQRVSIPLGDEDAWAFGMTCAGNVDLFIEPVDAAASDDSVAAAADAVQHAIRSGHSAVEIVRMTGRPHRLIVMNDGTRYGSLDDESLDADFVSRATGLIDSRASGLIVVDAPRGRVELFVRVHAAPPPVIVVGATDIAIAFVRLARELGFHTTVIDSRDRWATRERFPTADAIRVGMPSELIADMKLTAAASLVLLSHDFKFDVPVLEVALKTAVSYIGVLGSHRRARALNEFLTSIGATEEERARIRIPVGLDIGARTPAEIALSVLAELVSTRRGRRAASDS